MRLLDSRRLTGPNLLWEHPGAVIDIAFGEATPGLVIGAWESEARRLLDEVGWKDQLLCVRCFDGGASLAISAPVDALYAATEVNEAAWEAARDLVAGNNRQLLQRVARQLREEIREEERPRLQRLLEAARQHGVPAVLDTDRISLGLGKHSAGWELHDLPKPDAVDWQGLGSIPLALVTGTNGKTTTVRLLASIGKAAGLITGVSSTDWLAVGDTIIEKDDYAGPEGARRILRDRRCEMAILETARGGLLRRGLAVNHADAVLITNIASDHIGEFGVQTIEELADVKWIATRALDERGTLVLNADDPYLVARAANTPAQLIWFSTDPRNPVLAAHSKAGGTVCTLDRNRIALRKAGKLLPIIPVAQVPICFGGAAHHNVMNALGASALAHALGLSISDIRKGLKAMQSTDNPGRANLYNFKGIQVLLDFAHNPAGLEALTQLASQLPAKRRLLVIGQAGDRTDQDIRDLARATAGLRFDRVLIKRLDKYSRGRAPGEAAAMLREEFRLQGYNTRQIGEHAKETQALRAAIRWAKPGDLIVFLAHEDRDAVMTQLAKLQAAEQDN
jgi:cyanophycin synthetase